MVRSEIGKQLPFLGEDDAGGVVAAGGEDAAAGMGAGAGEVEAGQAGDFVFGEFGQGAEHEHLVEAHFEVHDVGAEEAEGAFEVERRLDVAGDHFAAHVGRVLADEVVEFVGLALADGVPVLAVAQLVGMVLAPGEEDVLALGREGGVERGEAHRDDGRLLRRQAEHEAAVRVV